ncbi:hypothetical protein COCC4DRAFT_202118 [Bipolaris maydis ATCC 48331]|uniref:Ubiquitin-like protease family profile domain-containing protein n=1 Tax=Cochliobolus heterostrophus (strain C4 / ATCC 48331 / race T) TaxID=665024 RepID=N4XAJ7_COCH4|nr:uncharacterized protein COCC4DRAFT_202118 [Bipolaris maydis ATCC 48331]ENI02227.1 hypothetical protein COCC4DRAFT_202118 [Bipolaris maydis ATCC 48331]KAJ5024436.1 hypothetical protein J3E73DRAFT_236693 [Bipolaris maydis]KAJ6268338.1 hypothetical protein PSV08DRAFT_411279 [Bipolaris maydis]KAJ6278586.1 hypothetical protein J3E71DRAFT_393687 [Bipolaris maydis]
MVLAGLLGVHFLVNVVGMYLLDTFPGGEVNTEYGTCWKDDGVMRALESWGWWARSIVVSGAVIGVMGFCTMIGYFFMALFAARMNQLDRQRPIGLQNLAPSRRTGNFNVTSPTSTMAEIAQDTPTTQTDTDHIRTWLKEPLLEFSYNDFDRQIQVREYLNITTTNPDDPAHWLESSSIDTVLALLTLKYHRSDVYILPMYHGGMLYDIGGHDAEYVFDEDQDCDPLKPVRDRKHRWIIVPVNEQTLQKEESMELSWAMGQAQDRNGSKGNDAASKDMASGGHCGLLVIDKRKKTARWIDGKLTLSPSRNKPGRMKINHMFVLGAVAATMVRGVERVLGLEHGSFHAKTVKYVPNQSEHNSFKRDGGASCGPYIIAFLEYVLSTKGRLADFDNVFKVGNWKRNCEGMAFDSLKTRVHMQEIIQNKSEKLQGEEEPPLKLSKEVYGILRPKVLGTLVAARWREWEGMRDRIDFDDYKFGGGKRRRGRGRRSGGGSSGNSGSGRGSSNGGGGGGGGSSGGDDSNDSDKGDIGNDEAEEEARIINLIETDEEDLDDNFFDPQDPAADPVSKKHLRDEIRSQLKNYIGMPTKDGAYLRAFEIQKEAAKVIEFNNSTRVAPEPASRTAPRTTPKPTSTPDPARPTRISILQYPEGITTAPLDFASTSEVPSKTLLLWRLANIERIDACQLGSKTTEDGISVRAILQVLSGVEFGKEPDERLTKIWINDPEVFNRKDRYDNLLPGIIAWKMKDRYELFDMENIPSTRGVKRGIEEARGGGHGDGDGDVGGSVGKKAKK